MIVSLAHKGLESRLIAYLCQRLAWTMLVLLGITGVVFVVVPASGDPAALYARLFTQGAVFQPMTVAVEMVPDGVRTRHTFSGVENQLEADTVVLAFGGKANDALFHEISGKVPELRLVGDACAPRRIHDALLEGTRAARAI